MKNKIYEESTINYTNNLEKAWIRDEKRIFNYFNKILSKIEKNFSVKKNKISIIDVGCGVGFGLLYFFNKGYRNLSGIDVNNHSIKIAKKKCSSAKIRYGDIYKLPYEKNKFDMAIFTEVIEHLDYPENSIKEIRRILKPGGILFLTTPNRMGLMGLSNGPIKFFTDGYYYKSILRILGKITCGPEHPREYFSFELANILNRHGFKTLHFPKKTFIPLFPAGKFYLIAKKI